MKFAISILAADGSRVVFGDAYGVPCEFDSEAIAWQRAQYCFAELDPIVVPVEPKFAGEFGDQ